MRRSILPIFAAACATVNAVAAPLTYYVSPSGNDANAGTQSAPFLTLTKARDTIRHETGRSTTSQNQIPGNWQGATVILSRGTYLLTSSFQLDSRDSGTETAPIIYRAATGEPVTLTGAKAIASENWKRVGNPYDLELIQHSVRNDVRQASLRPLGSKYTVDSTLPGARTDLYVNGEPMLPVQLPNIPSTLGDLDQSGEWFLDSKLQQLFFLPKSKGSIENASIASTDRIISASGSNWTGFSGLTIEGSLSHGVVIENATGFTISSAIVQNTGGWGIRVEGGTRARISNVKVKGTGGGAIFADGGSSNSATKSNHRIEAAEIQNFSRIWHTEPGIMLAGFGNTVTGSVITASGQSDESKGIVITGGNGNTIQENQFTNCGVPIFVESSNATIAEKNQILNNRTTDNEWLVDGNVAAIQLADENYLSDGVTKEQLGNLLKNNVGISLPPLTGLVFYVSPSGSDSNSGTSEQSPFATLEAARNAIRAATGRTSGSKSLGAGWQGAAVVLMPGLHKRTSTFTLDERDRGSKEFPIEYIGSGNTSIDGSINLKSNDWKQVTSADSFAWSRLPAETRGKTWKIDLSSLGISVGSLANGKTRVELIDGKTLREMARFPAYPKDRAKAPDFLRFDEILDANAGKFRDSEPHLSEYELGSQSPLVWIFSRREYSGRWDTIGSIANSSDSIKTISLSSFGDASSGMHTPMSLSGGGSGRYAIYNCLEDLKVEGTYCLVTGSSTIYYLPPGGTVPTSARVTGMDREIVTADGVSWVNFRNLTFEGGREDGWHAFACSDMVFENVTFQNFGLGAAFGTGGRSPYWGRPFSTDRNSISDNCDRLSFQSCTFQYLGGIALGVISGDRANLIKGNVTINGCTFRQTMRLDRTGYNVGVWGWGFEIANCTFTELPFVGVRHFALSHIHHNTFQSVMLEGGDYGATYTGTSATANRGTIIEHNTISDVGAWSSPTPPEENSGGWGIYIDDLASGMIVRNNTLVRCGNGILFTGSDHRIENNRFTDCHRVEGSRHNETITLGNRVAHTEKINSRDAEMANINGSGKTVADAPWSTYWPGGVAQMPGGRDYDVRMRAINNVVEGNYSTTAGSSYGPPDYPYYSLIQIRDTDWLLKNQPDFFKQLNFDRDHVARPIADLYRK